MMKCDLNIGLTRRAFIGAGAAAGLASAWPAFAAPLGGCAYAPELRDRCWMLGLDSQQCDSPTGPFNIPLSADVSMADACAYMDIPNVRVIRRTPPDAACRAQLARLKRVSWVTDDGGAYPAETDSALFDIRMWDFGRSRPLGPEAMRRRLDRALCLFRAGRVGEFVFHCTPLVNKGLPEVELCREWIAAHGNEKIGSHI